MEAKAKQGLFFGLIAGAIIGVPFTLMTNNYLCLLLIPVAGILGMAPQLLRPADDERRPVRSS
ncbi:MAG: hypothetical protein IKP20_02820 [Candidatus Methanomethylophilaceae archaeon]|jgi:hypothetical protein|nr:hypothetical protein [Candidatus Methanomethylophilaceae archaeon]